jgi:putative transposase
VGYLVAEHEVSIGRACDAVGMSRASWYKRPQDRLERDKDVITALTTVTDEHRRWGFWKSYDRLRLDGHRWNHKRVHRVYCQLGLNHKRRTKRRLPVRDRQPLDTPSMVNAVWAIDFMSDALYVGRRFRTLNVLDEGMREGLTIEIDTSLPGERVVRVLERLCAWRGVPEAIRCDNGPELTSQVFVDWCERMAITLRYIQPGKPNQNAFIERFNRTYREEVLNSYLFEDLDQVREITYEWLIAYNEQRPHDALGGLPPVTFREQQTVKNSTYELST